MAVSLSLANRHASLPVAYQLYLPQEWASDRARRHKAGVPEEIAFKTKPEIALDQLRWAYAAGLPCGVVLLDAGYGNNSELRADITALGATYVAGIQSTTTVWVPGARPLPAKTWSGRGRRPKLMRRDDKQPSITRSPRQSIGPRDADVSEGRERRKNSRRFPSQTAGTTRHHDAFELDRVAAILHDRDRSSAGENA